MPQQADRFRGPAAPRKTEATDGVLVVDKPAGWTSHDVVAKIRNHFGIKKVGHGGTLDPQATGLLAILLGRGTKLSGYFLGDDKTYEGTIRLGVETNSQDADGEVVREAPVDEVTRESLESAMASFVGDQFQTPPMVSAIKIDGVPLYKRARKGEVVEREPRFIHVYEFKMLACQLPDADFRVRCTKGTYVRTLCADIGQKLGCGAHLARLRRTCSGDLKIEDALSLDRILEMDLSELVRHIIPARRFRQ